MNKAVYPGTFDPITLGHVDLVERAARIFDHIVVAVASNQYKKPCFTLTERVELAKQAFEKTKNVTVIGFETLLTDFIRTEKISIILRGLRVVSDFDYEFQLAGMNRHLAPEVDSLFLMPSEHYTYISSSFVREIAFLGGDITQFVPSFVVSAFQRKLEEKK